MKNTTVYCCLIEIQPLDGCELDPSETAGAAVRCYIPAADIDNAIECLKIELREMKIKLVEIEWCVDYNHTEWENSTNEDEENYVVEARDSGKIVFDSFHTWGHDTLDVT